MRFSRVFSCFILMLAAASAAELKIKVVDPHLAPVAGAQVELLEKDSDRPAGLELTSGEGLAEFRRVGPGMYHLRVLAPGFAAQTTDVSSSDSMVTVALQLAPTTERVVVTATRNPVPSDVAGADVENLNSGQLQTMHAVALNDALRFLPGAVVDTAGQRGGLASLFVRGGDSRYNKVIIDNVPVNEPGGTFNFGVVPLTETDRMEFLRGAQSTLYGSDAMTSVVQVWTRTGSTQTPELRLGADGGTFGTANGYVSLAGARGRVDYNIYGGQFNTNGQGPNDEYSNSFQGANVGAKLTDGVSLRLRTRHANSRSGVIGAGARSPPGGRDDFRGNER